MSPIFGWGNGEEETRQEREYDFDSMDSEEFFDSLLEETANEIGVSIEELEEMDLEEIDEKLDTRVAKPYHPRGAREGYRNSDRLDTVSKEELENRKKVVDKHLGL